MARRNPARDDKNVYAALALIAKRNGADMVGRSMVVLEDNEGRQLWLTYEPSKARRSEFSDGPFWIRVLHYNPKTMTQAKMQRDVFAKNVGDAAEMFQHFRQRLWPQHGYAKRRFEEIGRRNPIDSDPSALAPDGRRIQELLTRASIGPGRTKRFGSFRVESESAMGIVDLWLSSESETGLWVYAPPEDEGRGSWLPIEDEIALVPGNMLLARSGSTGLPLLFIAHAGATGVDVYRVGAAK